MAPNGGTVDPPRKGLWQWFWRGAELKSARNALQTLHAAEHQLLQRARTAVEFGDRAFDPVEPLRSGPSLPLALSLYREAAYWALLAQNSASEAGDLTGAFLGCPEEALLFAAGGAEGLEGVRGILLAKTFRDTAQDLPDVQAADARAAQAFVKALIELKLAPEQRIGRFSVQRWVRTSAALIATIVLIVTGAQLYATLTTGPDLALGRPWSASSADTTNPPREGYFVHTLEEKDPWVQFDLGAAQTVSVVEVANRQDCCPDRALPAVVELSSDGTRWKEVSRRTESFSSWRARFAPTKARYVRVRVARRTTLHLAAVHIRAH